jgi:uncharacterized protein (TIGR02145 family)
MLSASFLCTLVSCDPSPRSTDASSPIALTARLDRAASVTDSVWNRTTAVFVHLATTNGTPLLEDTVAFSAHGVPVVKAPEDQGVVVTMEGLSNNLTVLWNGSTILPPSTHDTTYHLLLSAIKSPDTANSASNGPASAPTFDSASSVAWAPNTYDRTIRVHLSSATRGSTIHYTLDGSFPTPSSPAYSDTGILVDSSRTLKAVTTAPGWAISTGLVRAFVLECKPAAIESIDIQAWGPDSYDQPLVISFASSPPGAEIHYTLDGTVPSIASPLASKNLSIDSSRTLKAVVYNGKCFPSQTVLTKSFKLQVQPVVIVADADIGWPPFKTGMACATTGASIHFARQNAMPTLDSTAYVDSIAFEKMDDSLALTAIAFDTIHPKVQPSSPTRTVFQWAIPWNTAISYGMLTDQRDGQSYRTVQVGSQTWMAENLNFNATGSQCGLVLADCHDKTGRSYTWSSAMDANPSTLSDTNQQGACPSGWHVPNNGEWTSLVGNASSAATAGTAMKSSSTNPSFADVSGYYVPLDGAFANPGTDDFGMRVLPAQVNRGIYGSTTGSSTRFWSATQSGADGWYIEFNNNPAPTMDHESKSYLFSLRCVKN